MSYRTVLRAPGAAAFFLTASFGRVGIAMSGLGIVWLVHEETGSYGTAGLVSGSFAVAEAVAGPQIARLIDRFGQTLVLPFVVLTHGFAVVALLAAVFADCPGWMMMVAGAFAGSTIPQLGALSATRWSALLTGERTDALPTAFSLESLSNAFGFLAGPLLVAGIAALGQPWTATLTAATLIVASGLGLAAQRRTAPAAAADAAERRRADRSLLRPVFLILIGLNLAVGVHFGTMQVSVAAFAVEHGSAALAVPLYAATSCSGFLAAWLYGLLRWNVSAGRQLVVFTCGQALACPLLLVADTPVLLSVVLVPVAMAIPPILVLFAVITRNSVHDKALTQAFGWQNSASAASSAATAAVVGRVIDHSGANAGFAGVAVAAVAMTTLALVLSGAGRGRRPSPSRGGRADAAGQAWALGTDDRVP